MSETLCSKYGFTAAGRKERLALMRFDERDQILSRQLHDLVIIPRLEELMDELYEYLLGEQQTMKILANQNIERLRETQRSYLCSLGQDYNTEAYFEGRLIIGHVHARIKLPLSLYQCTYTYLRVLIKAKIDLLDDVSEQQRIDLHTYSLKIISLDISLATDTYFSKNLEKLEDSVSDLQGEKEALSTKVNVDMLTGVHSRESIMAEADIALVDFKSEQKSFSVLLADIDYFKKVNDSYGHATGDEVLKKVAKRLEHALRGNDKVGRIGGEEFLILLPESGLISANVIAERLRQVIEASTIKFQESMIDITISLGAAEINDEESLVELIDRADQALYEAKKSGRNQVRLSEFNSTLVV